MAIDFDVCIIGSGAGAGPVALRLAQAGLSVVVLEKGPWLREGDFYDDELACCRRPTYNSDPLREPQTTEMPDGEGGWERTRSDESGWSYWNGNCVGGSSNFMSGYFYRMKPVDFRLRSAFGPVEGANVVDWPIGYEDLEPYYDVAEREVGVSGRVVDHPQQEPRSSPDFPQPPTREHPVAAWVDDACERLDLAPFPTPRAILSEPRGERGGCAYSGFCGSFGCATGAKGSARAALLDRAVATGHCHIRSRAMVHRLASDRSGRVTGAEYYDAEGKSMRVAARAYVVACQAIETARLLLRSTGPAHPHGLANGSGQVGRNLLFAGGGAAGGQLAYQDLDAERAEALATVGPFLNRTLQDWYVTEGEDGSPRKGGTVNFLLPHPVPIARAEEVSRGGSGRHWGRLLKRRLRQEFREHRRIELEAFADWLPHDDCHVTLDPKVRDRWGLPVARVRAAFHPRNLAVGWQLASRGAEVLKALGAQDVRPYAVGSPPTNLQAGGCRFGTDPARSVLDPDCRAHEADNLFVTDGSFMPTAGSAPYTWTIYANAFRVADRIRWQLSGDPSPDPDPSPQGEADASPT